MTAAGAIKFHWIHPHNIFEEVLRILSGLRWHLTLTPIFLAFLRFHDADETRHFISVGLDHEQLIGAMRQSFLRFPPHSQAQPDRFSVCSRWETAVNGRSSLPT